MTKRKLFTPFKLSAGVLLSLQTLVMASCITNVVYNSYESTLVNGWEKNDTLIFNIPPLVASATYTQEVGMRTNSAFPFTSLNLIVEQQIYPSGRVISDTLHCVITDERGNVKGDGISAYQYTFPLRDLQLQKGDSIHVAIRHNMKREIIPGVSDVGIKMLIAD